MKTLKLLSYSKITAISSAVSALISQGSAEAGIVFFDVNPDLNLPIFANTVFGEIDLNTETYSRGSNTGSLFRFTPNPSSFYMSSGGGISLLVDNGLYGTYAASVSRASQISGALVGGSFGFAVGSDGSRTAQNEASGATFIPLRLDVGGGNFNYGWVQIFSGVGTYTVTGFAFEKNVNTPILAGDTGGPAAAVPEPGSLAVVSGLFGMLVAANRRARKRNDASAPDSLLNLASGARGVQKFREESAA
jgi:hypothetical protein